VLNSVEGPASASYAISSPAKFCVYAWFPLIHTLNPSSYSASSRSDVIAAGSSTLNVVRMNTVR
jgi:hypothetical protein